MTLLLFLIFFTSFLNGEPITRESHDFHYLESSPKTNPSPRYPWSVSKELPPITREHFKCRGNRLNPIKEGLRDCGGVSEHSLPLREGKEFIYPILIKLLNTIQETTGKKVIVTSGHRCPEHNRYIDNRAENETSKHQLGAEVSFFVEGLESSPEKIVDMIINFYSHEKESSYQTFKRYERGDTNVSILPWYNKEIFIKIFKSTEGRNGDNTHNFPYIAVQVRYDREKEESVVYSWPQAYKNYYRY